MNCEDREAIINDYVDGLLDEAERRALEDHLPECDRCARVLGETRALLAEAGALPRDVLPERDLWPGVERKIAAPSRTGFRWQVPAFAAAAALVLMAATALVTWQVARRPGSEAPAVAAASVSDRGLREAERDFNEATMKLLEVLRSDRARVRPETLQLVEANLEIINEAIAETRTALEKDPANTGLGRVLMAMYQKKSELLRNAARLSPAATGKETG